MQRSVAKATAYVCNFYDIKITLRMCFVQQTDRRSATTKNSVNRIKILLGFIT